MTEEQLNEAFDKFFEPYIELPTSDYAGMKKAFFFGYEQGHHAGFKLASNPTTEKTVYRRPNGGHYTPIDINDSRSATEKQLSFLCKLLASRGTVEFEKALLKIGLSAEGWQVGLTMGKASALIDDLRKRRDR
jgi:hypothetical protein